MTVTLHGYRYSVYARVARLALHEKGVDYDWIEVDPFAETVPESYLALHPFQRVPVLVHGDFSLYETVAITRYVDEAFDGPALQPADAAARARMAQIISIVDSYAYWPLVRQVFSHRVFQPAVGQPGDETQIRGGLTASHRVLAALENLAPDAPFLTGEHLSLADLHLAPMIAYFALAPEGTDALARHPRLAAWHRTMTTRPAMAATDPRPFRAGDEVTDR